MRLKVLLSFQVYCTCSIVSRHLRKNNLIAPYYICLIYCQTLGDCNLGIELCLSEARLDYFKVF